MGTSPARGKPGGRNDTDERAAWRLGIRFTRHAPREQVSLGLTGSAGAEATAVFDGSMRKHSRQRSRMLMVLVGILLAGAGHPQPGQAADPDNPGGVASPAGWSEDARQFLERAGVRPAILKTPSRQPLDRYHFAVFSYWLQQAVLTDLKQANDRFIAERTLSFSDVDPAYLGSDEWLVRWYAERMRSARTYAEVMRREHSA